MSPEECQILKSEIERIIESEAFLEDLKNLPSDKRMVNVMNTFYQITAYF